MTDDMALVEQARERMDDPRWSVRVPHDALSLLAGLTDAVRQLERERGQKRDEAAISDAAAQDRTVQRDAARARVASLEAGIAEHREYARRVGDKPGLNDRMLWALLDAEEQSDDA